MVDTADLQAVRDWVGSAPEDPTVAAALDRFDGDTSRIELAALAILGQRYADLLTAPATWQTSGDYSESWAANMAAVEKRIGELRAITGTSPLPPVTVAQLTRPDHSRGWR